MEVGGRTAHLHHTWDRSEDGPLEEVLDYHSKEDPFEEAGEDPHDREEKHGERGSILRSSSWQSE